jgi:hypothetical protein
MSDSDVESGRGGSGDDMAAAMKSPGVDQLRQPTPDGGLTVRRAWRPTSRGGVTEPTRRGSS